MNLTSKIGRVVFAIPFFVSGLFHFINGSAMTGIVPKFLPAAIFWVYLVGLALILASISFVIDRYVKLAGLLLAILLFIFVLTIHLPGVLNPHSMMMSMPMLLKDFSLAGGALILSGVSRN